MPTMEAVTVSKGSTAGHLRRTGPTTGHHRPTAPPPLSQSASVVGSCAVLGASLAFMQRGRRSVGRQSMAKEAFDVWNPSTYGNITMDDVKKYGTAGTLSYVITELIFWAVAFPTEIFIYLQTAGHWPDFSKPEESAAVFGMVFAASNVARLLLPLRFGAALAMAPWVDENIMQRFGTSESEVATATVPATPSSAAFASPSAAAPNQFEEKSELRAYLLQS
eukprot:symbB.v1.2.000008.t1/scaffold5.1/size591573/8